MSVHMDITSRQQNRGTHATPASEVSLTRLYALRFGYLVFGLGLVVVKWPLFFDPHRSWTLMEGVVNCMLAAMSVLALLGIRYPLHLLPVLLFESAWKVLWLGVVALPMWTAGRMDPATAEVAYSCLWVVIILAVIPWRHVVKRYLAQPGERWRSR